MVNFNVPEVYIYEIVCAEIDGFNNYRYNHDYYYSNNFVFYCWAYIFHQAK